MSYYIGIDLGGTSIKVGITDENGKIICKLSRPTKPERGHMSVIKDMAELTVEASDGGRIPMEEISCVGIGCPGSIDRENGVVEFSGNLNWRSVGVRECMENLTGKRIYIENDANAAAFGEYIAGSLKGTDSGILITLGTGVGSGIVLDGRILEGANGMGGELGHMVIKVDGRPCTCGRKGCFEAYASATALIELAKEKMRANPKSLMWESCGGNLDKVSGIVPFAAAKEGDAAANETVNEYIKYLASGIISAINIFQPQIVAIGGGLSGSADVIIPAVEEYMKKEVFSRHSGKQALIRRTELGNDAGIIGAAMLWKNK